jgi:hypothetical protein
MMWPGHHISTGLRPRTNVARAGEGARTVASAAGRGVEARSSCRPVPLARLAESRPGPRAHDPTLKRLKRKYLQIGSGPS